LTVFDEQNPNINLMVHSILDGETSYMVFKKVNGIDLNKFLELL